MWYHDVYTKIGQGVIRFPYNMDGTELTGKSLVKYLGVAFDCRLSFSEHVIAMCKAAYSLFGFIHRSGSFIKTTNSLKLLYYSLVLSRIEYASAVRCPHQSYIVDMIEGVQNLFERLMFLNVFGSYTYTIPHTETLNLFDITSLEDKRGVMAGVRYLISIIWEWSHRG